MLKAGSHLVIASRSVPTMRAFFEELFSLPAHYSNEEFTEFVLPSRFRIAFFKPSGKAAEFFSNEGERHHCSFGITVENVDAVYERCAALSIPNVQTSGPPKDHPWGERSFLLIDPEGNRWEITQTPSTTGMLVDRD